MTEGTTMTAEREAIVRWLRSDGPDRDNGGPCRHVEHAQGYCTCNELADAIERGDHLKESTHE